MGHVLHALHKRETDDLVRNLQQEVEAVLRPRSRRNDQHARVQADRQRCVINAWYSWAQEFFGRQKQFSGSSIHWVDSVEVWSTATELLIAPALVIGVAVSTPAGGRDLSRTSESR